MLLYYVNDETYLILLSSLKPHFFAHSPSPPLLIVVFAPPFLTAPPPSGDAGKRAWEGAPAAVVLGHAATDECNGQSPLRPSLSMPLPPPRQQRWRRIAVTALRVDWDYDVRQNLILINSYVTLE
jgi:hypothetical protein